MWNVRVCMVCDMWLVALHHIASCCIICERPQVWNVCGCVACVRGLVAHISSPPPPVPTLWTILHPNRDSCSRLSAWLLLYCSHLHRTEMSFGERWYMPGQGKLEFTKDVEKKIVLIFKASLHIYIWSFREDQKWSFALNKQIREINGCIKS